MRYLSQCEKMEGNIYIKLLCYYIISWSLELGPSLLTSVGNHPEVALSQLWRHCSHYRPRVSSFHRRHAEESVNYTNISFYVSIYYHICLWEWRPPTLILKVFIPGIHVKLITAPFCCSWWCVPALAESLVRRHYAGLEEDRIFIYPCFRENNFKQKMVSCIMLRVSFPDT